MSKKLNILWAIWILTALFVGCDRKDGIVSSSNEHRGPRNKKLVIQGTADLRRFLLPGMGTNEIVAIFGEPRWAENLSRVEQVWHYGFPPFAADNDMRGSYITGITVGVTNGHLANWGCSYMDVPNEFTTQTQDVRLGNKEQKDSSDLRVFIVSSSPVTDGQFIDTERFPKLGFIPPTPNLEIKRVKDVTLEERRTADSSSQSGTVWSFGVFLTKEDGARLKILTATNVSKRVLIMLGNKPVSAPIVMAPLETGSLVIECFDRPLMEAVKNQLASMK